MAATKELTLLAVGCLLATLVGLIAWDVRFVWPGLLAGMLLLWRIDR